MTTTNDGLLHTSYIIGVGGQILPFANTISPFYFDSIGGRRLNYIVLMYTKANYDCDFILTSSNMVCERSTILSTCFKAVVCLVVAWRREAAAELTPCAQRKGQ